MDKPGTKAHPGFAETHPAARFPPRCYFPASLSPPWWGNHSPGKAEGVCLGVMMRERPKILEEGRGELGMLRQSHLFDANDPKFLAAVLEGLGPVWNWETRGAWEWWPGRENPKFCSCLVESNISQQPPNPSQASGMFCVLRNWLGWDPERLELRRRVGMGCGGAGAAAAPSLDNCRRGLGWSRARNGLGAPPNPSQGILILPSPLRSPLGSGGGGKSGSQSKWV